MRSNIIEQGAVILFGEREDNISKFYTRIKDLTKLDWSKESYSSFSAMIAQESYKKNPWCKEWNNLSAVSIAKLWVLVNQDYNNNLKATIRAAGFSDSKVQQLFLDGIGILRPRTKKLLIESELFTELELKLIRLRKILMRLVLKILLPFLKNVTVKRLIIKNKKKKLLKKQKKLSLNLNKKK